MTTVLLDQGLAPRAATALRLRGIDAVHVSEIGMAAAEDIQILEAARKQGRICVTLDHDFHSHIAIAGHGRPSVILLRVEGLSAEAQAELKTKIRAYSSICISSGCRNRTEPRGAAHFSHLLSRVRMRLEAVWCMDATLSKSLTVR